MKIKYDTLFRVGSFDGPHRGFYSQIDGKMKRLYDGVGGQGRERVDEHLLRNLFVNHFPPIIPIKWMYLSIYGTFNKKTDLIQ